MKICVEHLAQFIKTRQYEILFILFLAYAISLAIKKARSKFPPGPMGLPLVGYLPFLTENAHLDFTKLGKRYGDVFSVRMGFQDILMLHGGDAVTEALSKPEFLGRPPNSAVVKLRPASSFFSGDILLWKEQRKFVAQFIKDHCVGKTKFEENIMDEISHFMNVLRSHNSQPVDAKKLLSPSISNNICALVLGKRFEYDDSKRQFLDECIENIAEHLAETSLDLFFPWVHYIPFASKFLESRKARTANEKLQTFFQKELNEHLKTFSSGHVQDFIDRYLVEIDIQKAKNLDTSFNHNMLVNNAVDLLIAGSEIVRTSFNWFIYIIAAFPNVQKKVQKEIMEVIGSEKTPESADMRNMPYTHSVMLEMMRWKSAVPLNAVHCTLADTTVGGYQVPKGTTVIANFWAVHHDPRYWKEPEKFNPRRFLSEDGKSVVKPSYFMPFALGKRGCPGEPMAYKEMFLYFISILREFDVAFADGTKPIFDAKFTLDYRLQPYLVRFIPKC